MEKISVLVSISKALAVANAFPEYGSCVFVFSAADLATLTAAQREEILLVSSYSPLAMGALPVTVAEVAAALDAHCAARLTAEAQATADAAQAQAANALRRAADEARWAEKLTAWSADPAPLLEEPSIDLGEGVRAGDWRDCHRARTSQVRQYLPADLRARVAALEAERDAAARADQRAKEAQAEEAKAERVAWVASQVAAHGTPSQVARHTAGVLPVAELTQFLLRCVFGDLADAPHPDTRGSREDLTELTESEYVVVEALRAAFPDAGVTPRVATRKVHRAKCIADGFDDVATDDERSWDAEVHYARLRFTPPGAGDALTLTVAI